MKVELKKTGEIFKIAEYDRIKLEVCDCYGNPIEVDYKDVKQLYDNNNTPLGMPLVISSTYSTDWDKIRCDIAKEALSSIMSNNEFCKQVVSDCADEGERSILRCVSKAAAELADTMVEELRSKQK